MAMEAVLKYPDLFKPWQLVDSKSQISKAESTCISYILHILQKLLKQTTPSKLYNFSQVEVRDMSNCIPESMKVSVTSSDAFTNGNRKETLKSPRFFTKPLSCEFLHTLLMTSNKVLFCFVQKQKFFKYI